MGTDTATTARDITDRGAALLVVAGAVLFFVPEPVMSIVGIALVLAAAGGWIAGRIRSQG